MMYHSAFIVQPYEKTFPLQNGFFWCWEVPAGSVKPGQTPEEAARAEMLEEVGGMAEALRMAHAGEISDGTSVLALLLCESKLCEIAGH